MAVLSRGPTGVDFFKQRLGRALERARLVLSEEKAHAMADEVHHTYEDKYFLAECMTNTALASQVNCLVNLGLTPETLTQLRAWACAGSAVSLKFRHEERCTLDREETREVEDPRKRVTESSVGGVVQFGVTSKVVHKQTTFYWRFEASYELTAVRGVGAEPGDCVSILSRTGRVELETRSKEPPRCDSVPCEKEVNVTWLLQQLQGGDSQLTPSFGVDRDSKSCRTPCRNPDVEGAAAHFRHMSSFVESVASWLLEMLKVNPDTTRELDLQALHDYEAVLSPVLPLLHEKPGTAAWQALPGPGGVAGSAAARLVPADEGRREAALQVLGSSDWNRLLEEEQRVLGDRRQELAKVFPSGDEVASVAEAGLVLVLHHVAHVAGQWSDAMTYIESLLRSQLIAAIGKEVSPADFSEYMRFHNRKLFLESYAPRPFCFSVRRSQQHSAEGTISIEEEVVGPGGDSNIPEPIVTLSSRGGGAQPMQLPLGAATSVTFGGERLLHAWLAHKFSSESGGELQLVARANQFSSMIVLVGRLASATSFLPKYAAIVRNKEELSIPLDLVTIPSHKEFKEAVKSLSPGQHAFAQAFRSMQLESTLFGVLVIQVKPQLERVLNLPRNSLTKEIKLTEDLLQLFTKYQIPSDLLSFDPVTERAGGATAAEKLDAVRANVKAMQEMIDAAKGEEVQGRKMERAYAAGRAPSSSSSSRSAARASDEDEDDDGEGTMMYFNGPVRRRCMSPCGAAAGALCSEGEAAECCEMEESYGEDEEMDCDMFADEEAGELDDKQEEVEEAGATEQEVDDVDGDMSRPWTDADELQQAVVGRDWTKVPKEMEKRLEALDQDGAVRPTIINPGQTWRKKSQKALLASPCEEYLFADEQKEERDAALDLLDALTKSGGLRVDAASLHVIMAATHCFDKTVTETVVEDNVNPIEKVERSTLIIASAVNEQPTSSLIKDTQYERVKAVSPMLFVTG